MLFLIIILCHFTVLYVLLDICICVAFKTKILPELCIYYYLIFYYLNVIIIFFTRMEQNVITFSAWFDVETTISLKNISIRLKWQWRRPILTKERSKIHLIKTYMKHVQALWICDDCISLIVTHFVVCCVCTYYVYLLKYCQFNCNFLFSPVTWNIDTIWPCYVQIMLSWVCYFEIIRAVNICKVCRSENKTGFGFPMCKLSELARRMFGWRTLKWKPNQGWEGHNETWPMAQGGEVA